MRSESVGEECHIGERLPLTNDASGSVDGGSSGGSGCASRASSTSTIGKSVGVVGCASTRTSHPRDRNSGGDVAVNVKEIDRSSCGDNVDNSANNAGDNSAVEPKHFRQYSDSLLDSGSKKYREHGKDFYGVSGGRNSGGATIGCGAGETEARDALARLEPRGSLLNYQKTGTPFRSASFGHADLNQGLLTRQLFMIFLVMKLN